MRVLETHACHGGTVSFHAHDSASLSSEARFGMFRPGGAPDRPVPWLLALAGLTCDHTTFLIKSGVIAQAAAHGLGVLAVDTSPRGTGTPGEDARDDLGTGAGFYCDATQAPWAAHYRMWSYVSREVPAFAASLDFDPARAGVIGHSMGGMGALLLGLRAPDAWRSVSALAPISEPSAVGWGELAFATYLGAETASWADYDPVRLLRGGARHPGTILVDQGARDPFLDRLRPEALREAAEASGQSLDLRLDPEFDHSYWFVQSVIARHVRHHAEVLS